MITKITMELFQEALSHLDRLLEDLAGSPSLPMQIKAIGGFALLFHSVRTSGYTADIDSVMPDYPVEIINRIESVAEFLGLESDWINNYNVLDNDVESIETMLDPLWEKADFGLRNIQLWVADMETLLRSKLLAAEDDEQTKRMQDFPDLIDILRKLDCTELPKIESLLAKMDLDLQTEYPHNYERFIQVFPAKVSKGRAEFESTAKMRRFD